MEQHRTLGDQLVAERQVEAARPRLGVNCLPRRPVEERLSCHRTFSSACATREDGVAYTTLATVAGYLHSSMTFR